MRLLTFLEAIEDDNKLGGGAGVLIYVPSTGRMLIQQRGEHPDDKDSGKYDFFGGTLEEGETAEECARREAKEEGQIEFPEDSLTEIGAFSSTEGGDWDGEPYHVFMFSATNEFRPKIQAEEVAKAGWIDPTKLNDQNSTNRIVKALAHKKVRNLLRVDMEEPAPGNPTPADRPQNNRTEAQHNKLISAQQDKLIEARLVEGKKDQFYQIFKPLADHVKEMNGIDIWESERRDGVKGKIDRTIATLQREDRILWALRMFKKMLLLELRSHAEKKESGGWGWTPQMEKQFRKLGTIDVSPISKFLKVDFEQLPGYKKRDEDKNTELVQLGWVDTSLIYGRRNVKEKNAANKKNAEIISQHYEDKPHLFNYHAYGGIDELLNEIGHYIGVGEAHTDVEPNNPIVSYVFKNQEYSRVKRELARLTKPLERKYKAGDVAEGQVFLELSPEWRWELLTKTCRKEAKALGHCGGVRDPSLRPQDRLLSLREIVPIEGTEDKRKRAWARLTFVYGTEDGMLSQMRGDANTKPTAEWHPLIVPLLLDPRVNGFLPVAYRPGGTFHIHDLEPNTLKQVITQKPELLTTLPQDDQRAVRMKAGLIKDTSALVGLPQHLSEPMWSKQSPPASPYPQAPEGTVTEAAFPYQEYQVSGEWYHGMASSSRAFVRRKGSHPSNIGIWLTNSKDVAAQFAQQASKRMVDDEPVLVTAQVRTESPMVYDTYKDYLEAWKEYGDSDKMRRALMRQGHDFIIIAQSDTDFGGEHRMDIAVFKTTDLRVLEKERLNNEKGV